MKHLLTNVVLHEPVLVEQQRPLPSGAVPGGQLPSKVGGTQSSGGGGGASAWGTA